MTAAQLDALQVLLTVIAVELGLVLAVVVFAQVDRLLLEPRRQLKARRAAVLRKFAPPGRRP